MTAANSRANRIAVRRVSRLILSMSIVIFLALMFFTYRLSSAESPITVVGGFSILITVLVPSLLWLQGYVPGLPVFPLFALTFAWTFALPLLNESPQVMSFDAQERLKAGLLVAAFLAIATAIWFGMGSRTSVRRPHYRMIGSRQGVHALIAALALDALFLIMQKNGLLVLSPGVASLVRGVLLGLGMIAAFVLPYLISAGRLSRHARWMAWTLLALGVLLDLSSLLMIGALSTAALALLGYTLGTGRLPIAAIATMVLFAVIFHAGKSRMRDYYWRNETSVVRTVSLTDYPAFFGQWLSEGAQSLAVHDAMQLEGPQPQSLTERSSLMHLLLRVRTFEANGTPPLKGATYAIIPTLLIPRILAPEKSRSHEGSYLLSINYGLQTRAGTYSTTIAWGLTNEAYANFGAIGLLLLAVVIGASTGVLASWTRYAPPLSVRTLFAILCLGYSLQAEFTAGVLVTALAQSAVGLLIFALFFARTHSVGPPSLGVRG